MRSLAFRARGLPLLLVAATAAVGAEPQVAPPDPARELQSLIDAGKLKEAEEKGRLYLATLERERPSDGPAIGTIIDRIVEAAWRAGRYKDPELLSLAERAVRIKEEKLGPVHRDLILSLTNLGNIHNMNSRYADARTIYERSVSVAEKSLGVDDPWVALQLNNLGGVCLRMGDHATAEACFRRSLAIREKAHGPDHPDVASTLVNIAGLKMTMGEPQEARGLYERALAIREKYFGKEHASLSIVLYNLARIHRDAHEMEEALRLGERALAIEEAKLGPAHPQLAQTLGFLGNVHRRLADYEAAESLYARALSIQEKALGLDHRDTANTLGSMATLARARGDFVTARSLRERELAVVEKVLGPDHVDVAGSLLSLANILHDEGDDAEAETLMTRALALHEKWFGPDHRGAAQMLQNLALVKSRLDKPDDADALFARALALREQAHGADHPAVASILIGQATVRFRSGDLAQARSLCERALAIQEKALGADHPEIATSLVDLAAIHQQLGDLDRAAALVERALALRRKALGEQHHLVAQTLLDQGQVLWSMKRGPEAMDRALAAEAIGREHLRTTYRTLPERQALRYAETRPNGLSLILSVAATSREPGIVQPAWDALVRSRGLVLDEMAQRHGTTVASADPGVLDLKQELDRARHRMSNLFLQEIWDSTSPQQPDRLMNARRDVERAEGALAERSARFRTGRQQALAGFEQVAGALPRGAALIAYALYEHAGERPDIEAPVDRRYLAFVLARTGGVARVVPLASAAAIDALVAEWSNGVRLAPADAAAVERARVSGLALRKAVWDPVAAHVAGVGTVFVVPDGSLHLVNLEALPDDGSGWLIEKGPMMHRLSTEKDLLRPSITATGSGLLAVGDPAFDEAPALVTAAARPPSAAEAPPGMEVYRGPVPGCRGFRALEFERLPASAQEVQEIAGLWTRSKAKSPDAAVVVLATRAEATEEVVRRQGPGRKVLHLATHAFVLGSDCPSAGIGTRGVGALVVSGDVAPPAVSAGAESPMLLSGLAFAGANRVSSEGGEESILTAEEIATLDLAGVEWVVLSACSTGTGTIQAGEGVLGLQRAFQVAGAASLIMSLWPVGDEPTRTWMRALYEARLMRRRSTTAAVREAGLRVLKDRRAAGLSTHPFYWGAFVASGDWR
ncbi:MAG: tetratricopeptide repeat protein [Candidatus Polarisedimenticolia bacterium]